MVQHAIVFIGLAAAWLVACGPQGQATGVHAEASLRGEARVSTMTLHEDGQGGLFVGNCPQGSGAICWADQRDPTDESERMLERQSRVAEQLHGSCPQLQPAEAEACEGFSAIDRAVSPLLHYQDIAGVMELKVERFLPGQTGRVLQTVGARVLFDPVPGLSEERLQALVRCHLARNRAMAYRMEYVSEDPLALQRIRAEVAPVGTGLAIDVRSPDPDVASEVLKRVRQIGLQAVQSRRSGGPAGTMSAVPPAVPVAAPAQVEPPKQLQMDAPADPAESEPESEPQPDPEQEDEQATSP